MGEIDKEESADWHRYFASVTNNRAWELSTQIRTNDEDREMLTAAHTSAYHWSSAGSELNRMRATMLLATVHAALGLGPSAYCYAEEMYNFFTANDCPDWELAFAHAIFAHACFADSNLESFRLSYKAAEEMLADIKDEEDRNIVLKTFNLIPKP